jgi:hypothetical protein
MTEKTEAPDPSPVPVPAPDPTPTPVPTPADDKRTKMLRDLVMGQTDYDAEEAVQKLKDHNNDILAIVREYMGAPAVIDEPKRTVNQIIYKEMRGLMDNAASTYRRKKELEEQRKQYVETINRLRAAAVHNLRSSVAMNSITETDADTSRDMIDVSGN